MDPSVAKVIVRSIMVQADNALARVLPYWCLVLLGIGDDGHRKGPWTYCGSLDTTNPN